MAIRQPARGGFRGPFWRGLYGVWGRCPQWIQGQSAWSGGRGANPLKLTVFCELHDKYFIKWPMSVSEQLTESSSNVTLTNLTWYLVQAQPQKHDSIVRLWLGNEAMQSWTIIFFLISCSTAISQRHQFLGLHVYTLAQCLSAIRASVHGYPRQLGSRSLGGFRLREIGAKDMDVNVPGCTG